jgi:murein hydrolase activator
MYKKIALLIALSIGITVFAQQPTKEELQRKQQELQKELAELNGTLARIQKSKKQSVGQLALVQRKRRAREELILNISKEMRRIDDELYLGQVDIYRMNKELDTLKKQYAQSIVFAYKNRSNYDYLNFIFSSNSFNDALKRVEYLKSYRKQRETQVSTIVKTQAVIQQKMQELNNTRTRKVSALGEQTQQLGILELDKKEKDKVVQDLKGQEKDIAKQIQKKDKQRKDLQASINAIIRRETEEARKRAAEEERKKKLAAQNGGSGTPKTGITTTPVTTTPGKPVPKTPDATAGVAGVKNTRTYSVFESTEVDLNRSINFETSKGRLPWPVDAGYISGHFGTHQLPGTRLTVVNDGIEISLPIGANVKCVADGVVASVLDLGGEQAVLVRHGKYFTTYSHLSSVNVQKDQQLKAGTILGKAGVAESGEDGQVIFMVTNDKGNHQNPESWLKRR